jgi:hypothetical protein
MPRKPRDPDFNPYTSGVTYIDREFDPKIRAAMGIVDPAPRAAKPAFKRDVVLRAHEAALAENPRLMELSNTQLAAAIGKHLPEAERGISSRTILRAVGRAT